MLLDGVVRHLDAVAELDVAGRGHTARQSVDVDEAVGGLLIEAVTGIVGGQVVVVQGAVGATAGDDCATAVQRHADLAVDVLLRVFDEGVQRLGGGAEPLRIVDQLGPALVDITLDAVLFALQAAVLQLLVCGNQSHGARGLVQLAGLDADQTILGHGRRS